MRGHLADPLLCRLYAIGALFMTVFGAVYTVIGYRLTAAPFHLPQGLIGSIFLVYLVGTVSSAAAGKLVGPAGPPGRAVPGGRPRRRRACCSRSRAPCRAILAGLVLITAGFFAGHAVASSAVSHTAKTGPRAGVRALPVRVLPGLQRGRHARRGRLPRGGLAGHGGAAASSRSLGVVSVTLYGRHAARAERRGQAACTWHHARH